MSDPIRSSLRPTRRAFLGAAAATALAPAACVGPRPGATPQPTAADVPAARKAWLPGTEGAGIADVLAGGVKPTGKLPCSWPREMAQIPINVGDPSYAPLFEYGFGLSW